MKPSAPRVIVKPARSISSVATCSRRIEDKGVYRALLDARLTRAARLGITLATTQAREATSAPILEALGFEIAVPRADLPMEP